MLAALATLVLLAGAGAVLTCLWDDEAAAAERLAAGACLGQAIVGLAGIAAALVVGFGTLETCLAIGVASLPLALLVRPDVRARVRASFAFRRDGVAMASALVLAGLGLLLTRVFWRAVWIDGEGLFTGDDHNLGDLSFHLAIVAGILHGGGLPPAHPELSGTTLTYPYLVDLVTAQLVTLGVRVDLAMRVQNVALAWGLAGILHLLARRLTGSRGAALAAVVLFFLSGGLGFLKAATVAAAGGDVLARDWTISWDGEYRWANTVLALLIPQRALLLGLPLALVALTALWDAGRPGDQARRSLLAAGAVAGLMPLAHAHAFAVLLATTALSALAGGVRRHLPFFVIAGLLALPQVAGAARGSGLHLDKFLAFETGWDHGTWDPVLFWSKNTGLFIPLWLLAAARLAERRAVVFLAPWALWFVVPNLLRLSPWMWDNIKFLLFWHVTAVPLVGLLLARLVRGGVVRAAMSAVLGISLCASGALDLSRLASGRLNHRLFDPDGLAFADRVREVTPRGAVIVHHPTYNHPALLAGRRSVLGFPGHIWSQGLDAGTREADIQAIYADPDKAPLLLARYGVDYVVVGPQERQAQQVAGGRGRLVAAVGAYRLYANSP